MESNQQSSVNKAFSKQSIHFDEDDILNQVLKDWRRQIYFHCNQYLKRDSKILELNSGTGIDAIHFAKLGHQVLATDLTDGMISKMKEKVLREGLTNQISVQQISFENIDQIKGKFDFVFSNFGGLNCIDDLRRVTKHLPQLLHDNAYITWILMPRIAPWEWAWLLKGKMKMAFRRFSKSGVAAKLEGEEFKTYYHSLSEIKGSFNDQFELIESNGLGILSPPPGSEKFIKKFPLLTKGLTSIDKMVSKIFPFNHWGDHLVVTFQFKK